MKLHIKNMVCDRCKMAVNNELDKIGIAYQHVDLGEITLQEEPSPAKIELLKKALEPLGFELMDDKKSKIISKIKSIIIKAVHYQHASTKNFSKLLSESIGKDYSALSNLFSEVEGTTIEQYIIRQKIERVKELLVYNELTLKEIAHQLGYSSVAHLSNQFKKITGLSPSYFKGIREKHRTTLDKV